MSLPRLYKKASTGKIQFWEIGTEALDEGVQIQIERGQLEGKVVSERGRLVTEGKNIGKANETTPQEQADMEVQSKWTKKKDEGYFETIEEAKTNVVVLPMLADKWEKHQKKISFPCYLQCKYDGSRCITDSFKLYSRKGKEFFFLDHILEEIGQMNWHNDFWLDGELYSHELTFQEIMSLIKKKKKDNTDLEALKKIEYHIYDCFDINDLDKPFSERIQVLNGLFEGKDYTYLKQVSTYEIESVEQIMEYHDLFVAEGYEGAMVRDASLPYSLNKRSNKLLKVKAFQDAEYEIVDVTEAEGEDIGTAVFVCKDKELDKTFSCRPKGTREVRRKYFENKVEYIGKLLTVEFFEKTDDGLPRFPVGKAIREKWDMS